MVTEKASNDILEEQVSSAEFSILSPTMALFASAISAGDPQKHGYSLEGSELDILLPERVWQTLGLQPSSSSSAQVSPNIYRITLDPIDNGIASYWQTLFPQNAPQLLIELEASFEGDRLVVCLNDEWLVWSDTLDMKTRLDLLDTACSHCEVLTQETNWVNLAELSVTTSQKFKLFNGVSKHLKG